ncbi:hypothetical protein BAU15_12305 [Enterococcus sp. JM4C]|uniref:hypothetical protein n=1 Tax=Candidatus Enterococcus huntleyi TaxID=1857217 RepID=UPI001379BC6D|nr:hypothetical protein [Enterococcus sp. JM4C]KAF1296104.1 hypothetical protein BAU15_12305 [Enterococcus sp. JM4C]
MKLFITRQTGFYGMGSPIEVVINGQKRVALFHQQTLELDLPDKPMTLQIKFSFLLRSPVYTIQPSPMKSYTVVMNPKLIQIYLLLFASLLLLPLLLKNMWLILILLIFYIIFLKNMTGKAYLLKENTHGETV